MPAKVLVLSNAFSAWRESVEARVLHDEEAVELDKARAFLAEGDRLEVFELVGALVDGAASRNGQPEGAAGSRSEKYTVIVTLVFPPVPTAMQNLLGSMASGVAAACAMIAG